MAGPLLRRAREASRQATARVRALPNFVVIGAMKAGTTSLYTYLSGHPQVVPALRKEVRYFDVEYARGERWYRSMFPTTLELRDGRMTGEASPYYLRHPLAAARCAALLPDVRLLVLLRDPTERAFSHWKHARRLGYEPLPFPEALAAERRHLQGEPGPSGVDADRHLSYVARGLYAEQLELWLEHYPREQLLVRTSEELFAQPGATYAGILEFLGLTAGHAPDFAAHNVGAATDLDSDTRAELDRVFSKPNARLAELLGWDDPWPTV